MKVLAVVAAFLVLPLAALSQEPAAVRPNRSSSPLPADHWAVEAARRAEALGLLTDYLPAQHAVPQSAIKGALHEAAQRASTDAPDGTAALTLGWERRFQREFPGTLTDDSVAGYYPRLEQGAFGIGSGLRSGAVEAGRGVFQIEPLEPIADQGDVVSRVVLAAAINPHLHLLLAPELGTGGVAGEWEARLGWRSIAVSVGRQPVLYGGGEHGVVLGSPEPWHRIQIETVQPWTLPGPLRLLGPTAFHTSFGRVFSERHPGHPYIWTASARARPHPRLSFGFNRAALLGGDSVSTPFTAQNFLRVVGGWQTGGFENQVVSLEVRYRLPTEQWLPLSGYLEWGFDDAAGAISDVPGYVTGVFAPVLPGLAAMSVGIEFASFAHSCCFNPPWYRHGGHPGGWANEQRPLGHPLGGNGTEVLAWMRVDPAESAFAWETRVWHRRRGAENLYAPERAGRSGGASGRLTWRAWARADAQAGVFYEAGDRWSETRLQVAVNTFF